LRIFTVIDTAVLGHRVARELTALIERRGKPTLIAVLAWRRKPGWLGISSRQATRRRMASTSASIQRRGMNGATRRCSSPSFRGVLPWQPNSCRLRGQLTVMGDQLHVCHSSIASPALLRRFQPRTPAFVGCALGGQQGAKSDQAGPGFWAKVSSYGALNYLCFSITC